MIADTFPQELTKTSYIEVLFWTVLTNAALCSNRHSWECHFDLTPCTTRLHTSATGVKHARYQTEENNLRELLGKFWRCSIMLCTKIVITQSGHHKSSFCIIKWRMTKVHGLWHNVMKQVSLFRTYDMYLWNTSA